MMTWYGHRSMVYNFMPLIYRFIVILEKFKVCLGGGGGVLFHCLLKIIGC